MATQVVEWVGHVLSGRYRVTAKLGEGGMGFVYRARDHNLDTDVVIKVPRRAMLENPEFAGRFAREIRALVQLVHPHIVKVMDVGEHDDLPFAVMQFLPGGSLRDRQQAGPDGHPVPMPLESLNDWLPAIAAALDYIHEQRHVHRDVKPENILFDAGGNAYLSDFGVAKTLADEGQKKSKTVLTGAGTVLGTPQYMAPELIMGKPYDGRADQYALGVMLYELLAGRYPFDGTSSTALFVQHTMQEAAPLDAVLSSLPKGVAAAVGRALAKDPKARWADCRSFAQAVLTAVAPGTGPAPVRPSARCGASSVMSVQVTIACPACGRKLGFPAADVGKRFQCPACGMIGRVPGQKVPTPAGRAPSGAETRRAAVPPAATMPHQAAPDGRPSTRNSVRSWVIGAGSALLMLTVLVVVLARALWSRTEGVQPNDGDIASLNDTPSESAAEKPAASSGPAPSTKDESGQPAKPGPAPRPKLPEKVTNSIGMTFVRVPRGTFWMGGGGGAHGTKQVTIPADFYLGVYEVTQGQWKAVMGAFNNPSWFSRGGEGQENVKGIPDEELDQFPVEWVSWEDAQGFIKRLNTRETGSGWFYRLPTQAEWEYACRGAVTSKEDCASDFYLAEPTNDLSSRQANFDGGYPVGKGAVGPYLERPCKVGSFPPNRLGLYDMHGNVWEWCEDALEGGVGRVYRGGGWSSAGANCRAAGRSAADSSHRSPLIGFRLARVRSGDKSAGEQDSAWVPLFNGKDLTGWKVGQEEQRHWKVEDGVLIGSSPEGSAESSYLFTESGAFRDFHLRIEAKVNNGGLAGVLFRTSIANPDAGYEAGINTNDNYPFKTGILFRAGRECAAFTELLAGPGQWFTLEVIADRSHVIVKVDGRVTADFVDPDPLAAKGFIALGQDKPAVVIRFRKVEVKELRPTSPRRIGR
jgi:formylglycine-generating enzyme required for sulfatase activity/tRNA A-37 threonylcarbamoyl transferase component Bud32/predicted RNA-binding Zn-ribbon protein involved in translation (DUF1610 family)